jgi:hypothetical protein
LNHIAAKRGLPVIDLATVFDKKEDYANPIEPSVLGADKLTANIIRVVTEHPWEGGHVVYADRTYSVESADDVRGLWDHEPRAKALGRWDWEVAEAAEGEADTDTMGDLPDLKDNDPFRNT